MTYLPPLPGTRPFRVFHIEGGARRFVNLTAAVRFAGEQAHGSWSSPLWTVRDERDGSTRQVDREGQVVAHLDATGLPVAPVTA